MAANIVSTVCRRAITMVTPNTVTGALGVIEMTRRG